MLGKIEGKRRGGSRRWDGWMASLSQWTWTWANSSGGQRSLECCSPWRHRESDKTYWLNNNKVSSGLRNDLLKSSCTFSHEYLLSWFPVEIGGSLHFKNMNSVSSMSKPLFSILHITGFKPRCSKEGVDGRILNEGILGSSKCPTWFINSVITFE